MKKTILAFVAGAVFATAGSVYADEIKTMIGKQIEGQFPVKVNGVPLEQQAIVVDGTSHLPVRAIADALNMDIVFDSDLGIEVSEKEEAQDMPITVPEESQDKEEKAGDTPNYGVPPISKEEFIKNRQNKQDEGFTVSDIEDIKLQISSVENSILYAERDGREEWSAKLKETLDFLKSELERLEAEKAALEQE